jgi:hypothetical protein
MPIKRMSAAKGKMPARTFTFVWLSFDLGVQGDYEGLYAWLDSKKAKECGANIACFSYNHAGDVVESLRRELGKNIKFNKRTRFYVIYKRAGDKLVGTFVRGLRKSPPWAGFGSLGETAEDTDA